MHGPLDLDGATNPPHVVQIVQAIDRGGLEAMAVNLAVDLRQRGYRSSIVVTESGGRLESRLREHDVEFHRLTGVRFLRPASHVAVAQLLRRLRPHSVHSHHLPPLLVAAPTHTLTGACRLVHTEHAFEYLNDAPRLRTAMRWASRATDVFAVVGERQAAYYADVVGVSRTRLRVIQNGIDLGRYRPLEDKAGARRALGMPDGFLIGAVGRFATVKNFPMLLRAAADLRARGDDTVRVVFVGDGEERDALGALASTLGIADHVHFLGWRSDVPVVVAALDVLALTSWSEGLPMVVLEAMACGVPVVATSVGDLPLVLSDGAGELVDIDDSPALATALGGLSRNAELRATLARVALGRVTKRYSQSAMTDRYLDAYGLPRHAASEVVTAR